MPVILKIYAKLIENILPSQSKINTESKSHTEFLKRIELILIFLEDLEYFILKQ
jgi:hypothetical protein